MQSSVCLLFHQESITGRFNFDYCIQSQTTVSRSVIIENFVIIIASFTYFTLISSMVPISLLQTYHLCRRCVPGEVVHSRGGQVMLIVLRKLLELVLVVREASIYAEIPAGRQTGNKVKILIHTMQCDRQTDGSRDQSTGSFLVSTGFSLISDSDSPVSAFGQVPWLL